MRFPRYPKYKASGVEWLGDVPEHWDAVRVRTLFEIRKRIAGELGHDVLSITQRGLKIKDIESNDGQLSMDYSKYQLVKIGDFAMNHMDLLTGWIDIATSTGVTSPDYRVFSVRDSTFIFDRFMLYVWQMGYSRRILYAFGQGSSQLGRWRLPTDEFNNLRFPLPPYDEQKTIAGFLDREITKIDALVAEQETLIVLLKEKRQAVIFHAVTKGVNPNAPMKPSGIESIGDIPKHWDIRVIKKFSTLQRGYDLTDEARTDGSYPVITSGGISGTHGSFMARGPGVVTGRYGSTGRLFYIEEDFWPHNTSLYVRDFHGNYPRFVWYSLQTIDFAAHSAKAAVPGIDRNDIHVLPVAVPPLDEQQRIVTFLDREIAKLETLTAEAQGAIGMLQERRSALISAAVTGQIDVRRASERQTV